MIRRATPADARLLAEHRAAVWHEVGEWSIADLSPQIPVWARFFERSLEDARYIAFVAEQDTTALGSGGILTQLTIPRPGSPSEHAGRVQSVYVVPEARRQGIGAAIMGRIISYAREATLVSLTLRPADGARRLYAALGFEAADEMVLHLSTH